jgi:hypothetical protein
VDFLCHINFDLIGAEIGLFDCGLLYNNPLSIGELFFYLTAEGAEYAEEERGRIGNYLFPISNLR